MTDIPVEAMKLNCQISTLLAVVENDIQKHHIHAFVIFGEQLQDDLRVWSNQLLTLPGYGGRVTVTPWKIPPSEWRIGAVERTTANSALHAVPILFRDAYFELFPDRPRITRTTSDESEQTALIDQYVWANRIDFAKRLARLHSIMDLGVIRELLEDADNELTTLIHLTAEDEPRGDHSEGLSCVTAKQLADHVGCVSKVIKTALQNCKPIILASGTNGGHQWRYAEAIAILKNVKTGKLKDVAWPDTAAKLTVKKDSSKIPAKTLRR